MNKKMFCPECGTPLNVGVVYCPECGKKITTSDSENNNSIKVISEKTSGFFWTRLFTVMTNIVLVFSILIVLLCFRQTYRCEELSYAIVGILIFVAILYSVSIAMVFSSMAENIGKITKRSFEIETVQKRQVELVKELITQLNKGEN